MTLDIITEYLQNRAYRMQMRSFFMRSRGKTFVSLKMGWNSLFLRKRVDNGSVIVYNEHMNNDSYKEKYFKEILIKSCRLLSRKKQ